VKRDLLPSDEAQDWIIPSNLLGMMDDPRFEKKAGSEHVGDSASVAAHA
jgi:hypothetical protein